MKVLKLVLGSGWLAFSVLFSTCVSADGWDPLSQATAIGSIANTRHNLTVSYSTEQAFMDIGRNNYGEVCIYCHTPHGNNTQIQAPLWNRTINNSGTYTIYDKPTTLMRPIGQPGPNSLTCLSCHDGTISIDSILNMPGSGLDPLSSGLTNNLTGTNNDAFLNQWTAAGNTGPSGAHFTLGPELGIGDKGTACGFCHDGALLDAGVPDYSIFMLGTDLRNDHPVGVQFPTTFGPGIDFNAPNSGTGSDMPFFDLDGDNHADPNEVRLYSGGSGTPKVECASCHDPHGVPSGGTGTRFNPTFLRVNNGITGNGAGAAGIVSSGASALCLTCHAK